MKKELTIAILTIGLTIGMASMASAQDNEETDVEVNVSSVTQLDVRPSALSYGVGEDSVSIEPGDSATVSDEGYEHVELGNIGSENIGEIYAEATMPAQQPFGAAGLIEEEDDIDHDTGNFITLSTETAFNGDYTQLETGLADVDTMHFLNRVEYSEETPPTYLTLEEGLADEEDTHVGRLRAGGVEYFYVLYDEDGEGTTTDDEWTLRIGNAPHTSSQLGTVDFSDDSEDYTQYSDDDVESDGDVEDGGDAYSRIEDFELVTFDVEDTGDSYSGEALIDEGSVAGHGLTLEDEQVREYNLYPYAGENSHVIRTKFNIDLNTPVSDSGADDPTESTSAAQSPIFTAGSSDNQLQPGDSFPVDIGIQVPQGVDQDRLAEGTVTILATEDGEDDGQE